jgi:hypothetical protein
VTRRAPVDGAPAIPLQILCDMRRYPQVATLSHKISLSRPLFIAPKLMSEIES